MADNKQSRVVFEELGKALDGYRGEWEGIEIANKNGLITFFVGGKEYRYEPIKESVPYGVDDGSGPDVRHLGDKPIGDNNVKINVDVSEAITGLKAVQREAKEATKALRGLEGAESKTPEVVRPAMVFDKGPGKVVEVSAPIYDLTKVPTKQLHEELAKREGVTEHIVKFPKGNAIIDITNEDSGEYIPMGGPARIIVIKE